MQSAGRVLPHSPAARSEQPAPRIRAQIASSQTAVLNGSLHPMARAEFDAGRMARTRASVALPSSLGRTPQQEAGLKALIAAAAGPSFAALPSVAQSGPVCRALWHGRCRPEQSRNVVAGAGLQPLIRWLEARTPFTSLAPRARWNRLSPPRCTTTPSTARTTLRRPRI